MWETVGRTAPDTRGERDGDDPPQPFVPLPRDLPNPREAARTVFDGMADLYDAARPGYPADVVAELVELCHVGPSSTVLEIGAGTGQLTRSLAPSGGRMLCLEPGRSLAGRARKNLASFANVDVVETTFEQFVGPPGPFDLAVSATAFHWIDPSLSFAKVAKLLGRAGHLVLITNVHGAGGSQERIAGEVQRLHRRMAPEVGTWTFPTLAELEGRALAGGDIAAVWHRVERKFEEPPPVDGLFAPPQVFVHPWLATYSGRSYLDMLRSQSSYALMEPPRRERLFDELGQLIAARLGDEVTKQYITVLAVARKGDGTNVRDPAHQPG